MRRSCLIPPTTEETSDPFEHAIQPIIWNYDHCLRLYPTPHTIVLGDKSEQKAFKYTGITCFNPGSFANDSTFAAYRPCTKELCFAEVRVDLSLEFTRNFLELWRENVSFLLTSWALLLLPTWCVGDAVDDQDISK
ncbi:hypothetical protein QYE76_031221 [Lolium multiflorum]|uniref:DNA polymerase II subunit 2 n=1 Tax=Lolium multiflorum TaxID=4521 RepID=A0AAD8VK38_LOLMU|nr:hypothetical protein QYE76_031221 [Lolium multiflorum]